jgi:hypothetical protein
MRGWTSLATTRASVLAAGCASAWLLSPGLAFAAAKSSVPSAKKPFAYETDGVVSIGADPSTVSGPAVLQFQGVTSASFNPNVVQPINLGQFVAVPSSLASGQTTTYNGTPFEVEIQTPEFNKSSSVPILDQIFPSLDKKLKLKSIVENSLLLKGHLDGTVGANGQVNVVATVDSIKLGGISGSSSDQADTQPDHVRARHALDLDGHHRAGSGRGVGHGLERNHSFARRASTHAGPRALDHRPLRHRARRPGPGTPTLLRSLKTGAQITSRVW